MKYLKSSFKRHDQKYDLFFRSKKIALYRENTKVNSFTSWVVFEVQSKEEAIFKEINLKRPAFEYMPPMREINKKIFSFSLLSKALSKVNQMSGKNLFSKNFMKEVDFNNRANQKEWTLLKKILSEATAQEIQEEYSPDLQIMIDELKEMRAEKKRKAAIYHGKIFKTF